MVKSLVGLGNPGKEYEDSRHNVGFMFIDFLLKKANHSKGKYEEGCLSRIYKVYLFERELLLVKPYTFMNNSGYAVLNLIKHYDLKPEEVMVIYDDLDLPLGSIRIRKGGSSGGHKGVESIINLLKTQSFPRLRIGISRPKRKEEVIDYVLSPFSKEEAFKIREVFERAFWCLKILFMEGFEKSMSLCNRDVKT